MGEVFRKLTLIFTKITLLLLFVFVSKSIFSQTNFVFSCGITFNVGTKINRVGACTDFYYLHADYQYNITYRLFYNFNSFGPPHFGFESQFSLGVVRGFGRMDSTGLKSESKFFSSFTAINNQTNKLNCFSFAYNFYFDNIKTSQRTGTIALEMNKFQFVHENDIWEKFFSDKYRTAALSVSYRYKNSAFGFSTVLWTGNANSDSVKVVENTDYPARFGYKNMEKVEYGNFSHGLFTLQIQQFLPYGQAVRANIGADSEKVRNIVQNKIIHDMWYLPKCLVFRKLRNIPMLDTQGKPYLYKPKQKIKPSTLFYNVSLNPTVFY